MQEYKYFCVVALQFFLSIVFSHLAILQTGEYLRKGSVMYRISYMCASRKFFSH